MQFVIIYQKGYESLLEEVRTFLSSHEVIVAERDCCVELSLYAQKDFVVVIGGDGTFLRASHFNNNVPAFGINPNPSHKEGFFMQSSNNWKEKLSNILKGKYKLKTLLRLQVSINGKIIKEMALNDVYVGDKKPYNMSNYELNIDDKKELQRSSGIIISTPAGSHAWSGSAGAKPLKIDAHKIQYLPRELYRGKLTPNYALTGGTLPADATVKLTPKTNAIVVLDSISEEYQAPAQSTVIITKTLPLKYIAF